MAPVRYTNVGNRAYRQTQLIRRVYPLPVGTGIATRINNEFVVRARGPCLKTALEKDR